MRDGKVSLLKYMYTGILLLIYRISKTQKDSYGHCSTENDRQFNFDEFKVDMLFHSDAEDKLS